MYYLLRSLPLRRLLADQAPAVAGSWIVAETFYKFHSFTLECGAFLATWYVLDLAGTGTRRLAGARHRDQ